MSENYIYRQDDYEWTIEDYAENVAISFSRLAYCLLDGRRDDALSEAVVFMRRTITLLDALPREAGDDVRHALPYSDLELTLMDGDQAWTLNEAARGAIAQRTVSWLKTNEHPGRSRPTLAGASIGAYLKDEESRSLLLESIGKLSALA